MAANADDRPSLMEIGQADHIYLEPMSEGKNERYVKVLKVDIGAEEIKVEYPNSAPGRVLFGNIRETVDWSEVLRVDDGIDRVDGDTSPALDEPIKVRWTGYARSRIGEYNGDFSNDRSDLVTKALSRQKTNVVLKTVDEATAVYKELGEYDSSQRVWMNGAMNSALNRVRGEIFNEMESQGFEPVYTDSNWFKHFE